MKLPGQTVSELTQPRKVEKLETYMTITDDMVRELIKYRYDVDKLRNILSKAANEQWLTNILDVYDAVIMAIAEDVIDKHSELVGEVTKEEYKIGREEKREEKKALVPSKTITVKRGNKVYQRGRMSWNTKQEAFVKSRMDLPAKTLQRDFALKFGVERSIASLRTKKYRLKNIESPIK